MKRQTITVNYQVNDNQYSVQKIIQGHENLNKEDLQYTARRIAQQDLQRSNFDHPIGELVIVNYELQ